MTSGSPSLSLGRLQLLGELGRGGMGRVLEAHDPDLGRSVAVKIVLDPATTSPAQLQRFFAEARITSRLEHPNIIPVYDMGRTGDGLAWFVMRKVEGRSLAAVLRALAAGDAETRRDWSQRRLLSAFVQVCNAVAFAHDRGVLHRDLKPSNVMLGRFGQVLVLDWGVARALGDDDEEVLREVADEETTLAGFSLGPTAQVLAEVVPDDDRDRSLPPSSLDPEARLTITRSIDGSTIGTPGYMAPEQALGEIEELDARSDVFSLGAMLYEILTLRRMLDGRTVYELLHLTVSHTAADPRERAPERNVPDELAELCVRATRRSRGDRLPDVEALARGIDDFLDGARRRERAEVHLQEARDAWARFDGLVAEQSAARARADRLDEQLPGWAPATEKSELFALRDRIDGLTEAREDAFRDVLSGCDRALAQVPGDPDVRAVLADAWFRRFEEAEHARDRRQERTCADRVRAYDDARRYEVALRGTGALTLRTDPPGATVVCERFEQRGLVWPLTARRVLGRTPILELPLEMGSYLLTIQRPGVRDVRYPVHITRGRHWDGGAPVPLYTEAEIGPECVYVPRGPFLVGGDPETNESLPGGFPSIGGFFLGRLPVVQEEYCRFINDLRAQGRDDEAYSRVPRQSSGVQHAGGQYWERPPPGGLYRVPEEDADGDRWDPRWPMTAVSWNDAAAYSAWFRTHDGRPWRLPTEFEWEKAARGVDGRSYPWGDGFDPSLCKMEESRSVRNTPEVVAAFPTDVSVYGVQDMAGGARDYCEDGPHMRDPGSKPVRGGSWAGDRRTSRCANRRERAPWVVVSGFGFRLARDAPRG